MKKFIFLYVGFDPLWTGDESKTGTIYKVTLKIVC